MESNTSIAPNHFKRNTITVEHIKELWSKTYNTEGRPDWSHILPYYDAGIYFRDSIQEIHGIEPFTAMTERLSARSKDLKMNIVNIMMTNIAANSRINIINPLDAICASNSKTKA